METVLSLIFNAENVRMLVLLAFGFSGFVLLKSQMKEMGHSLNRRIDGVEASVKELRHDVEVSIKELRHDVEVSVKELRHDVEASIKELKYNDFAHLNATIEALTYALEKKGSLDKEDKEYIDSRLSH